MQVLLLSGMVMLEHQLLVLLLEQLADLSLVIVETVYDFVKLGAQRVKLLGVRQALLLLLQLLLL